MTGRTTDPCDAHMRSYRDYLQNLNCHLAEDYLRQHSQHISTAMEELVRAVPLALAIAQLHEAIRRSPAKDFWPIIRTTKGVLLVRSKDTSEECPWPWKRSKRGNMRYDLPGHLLFSAWPPNFQRWLQNGIDHFQRLTRRTEALESETDFRVTRLASSIFWAMVRTKHYIPKIKAFQGFATPASIAALDRWSDEQRGGSNIALRISQGMLVYKNGSNHCEIKVPDALNGPLCLPSAPDPLVLHMVRAGKRSYYP